MKKNKLLILVVALMATLSLTACLNDDYEEQAKRNLPTAAELKAASHTIQGLYHGKLSRIWSKRTGTDRKSRILLVPLGKSRMIQHSSSKISQLRC